MTSELVLRIEMGTPTTGIWCVDCLLPARFTAPIHRITDDGVNRIGSIYRCTNCNSAINSGTQR